jgi:hypothetical protein
MKLNSRTLIAACFALMAGVVPVIAHHSFAAEFDSTKVVTLTGAVTKVEWANPHARFYIDAKDKDGKMANWNFELGSPNGLMRLGWNRNSLKIGEMVTVNGTLAKNAPYVGNARTVTLASGKRLFAGSSEGDTTPAP